MESTGRGGGTLCRPQSWPVILVQDLDDGDVAEDAVGREEVSGSVKLIMDDRVGCYRCGLVAIEHRRDQTSSNARPGVDSNELEATMSCVHARIFLSCSSSF